jgi:hypothetical protein
MCWVADAPQIIGHRLSLGGNIMMILVVSLAVGGIRSPQRQDR